MIRPLRQVHCRLFIVLGIFLPVVFAAGIVARRPVAPDNHLPARLKASQETFEELVWSRDDLFSNAPIELKLLRKENSGRLAVAFSAARNFVKPDLLAYWVAGDAKLVDRLPDNAVLLGAFNEAALPLPAASAATSGVLVLYSLADNELVAVSQPVRLNDSTK